jgi:NodT family efflux transporter outer membrane factor (OMF) lipoprotein
MSKLNRVLLFSLLIATLPGCVGPLGPQRSGIDSPLSWNGLPAGSRAALQAPLATGPDAEVDHRWWRHFGDPTLDLLIDEALANNKTLQIAKARVEEARAGRGVAEARLFPEVNANASAVRGNQGYATNNTAVGIAGVNLEASWQIDLFGRNRARAAEAGAIWESQEASQRAVRVGLLVEVARNYFEMRNSERQLSLTRQNLETQKKTLELVQAQMRGALASDFDVQRAGAQVSTTEALLPSLETAHDAARNRLNVLLGLPPGTKDPVLATPQELRPLDHGILIAAPAKVLAARPDVRAAERRFAASISAKDAAKAELFPDISLTALFGAQASTPFAATPWGIGVNLVQPILNFGAIKSRIKAADSQQLQAFLNYQQTVLEALADMENALSGYLHETARNASLVKGVEQNRRAAELAMEQYRNGYTGLLDVLVAVRNRLDSEASLAASDAILRSDLVNIFAAAGGGWRDDDATAEVANGNDRGGTRPGQPVSEKRR